MTTPKDAQRLSFDTPANIIFPSRWGVSSTHTARAWKLMTGAWCLTSSSRLLGASRLQFKTMTELRLGRIDCDLASDGAGMATASSTGWLFTAACTPRWVSIGY